MRFNQYPPPAKTTITLSCHLPEVSTLPETKELQSKGTLNISLALENYKCVESSTTKLTRVTPNVTENLQLSLASMGKDANVVRVLEETITQYQPVYNRMAFKVKIYNQSDRVLRTAGTVVLYNFGGKNVSTTGKDYEELSNLIVPPRTEREVTIYGPEWSNVEVGTTLGIFLYDLPTKMSKAGQVVEKQNFEWYYTYAGSKVKKKDFVKIAPVRKWIKWQTWQNYQFQNQQNETLRQLRINPNINR